MGHKQDIEEALKDYHVTCIDGQPTDQDLTRLKSELSTMVASIPATNGGGLNGHVGMLCEDSNYTSFWGQLNGTPVLHLTKSLILSDNEFLSVRCQFGVSTDTIFKKRYPLDFKTNSGFVRQNQF